MIELPKFQTFYSYAKKHDFAMSIDLAFDVYAHILCSESPSSWQYMLENYQSLGLDSKFQWNNLTDAEKPKEKPYVVYTDGACNNNSVEKIGGAGYFVMYDGQIVSHKRKGFVGTTNNRMELLAIASALKALPEGSDVVVNTDSQYCIQTIYSKQREAKKNPELVSLCRRMRLRHRSVDIRWVRGHDGERWNEFVDDLANTAYMEMCDKYGVRP